MVDNSEGYRIVCPTPHKRCRHAGKMTELLLWRDTCVLNDDAMLKFYEVLHWHERSAM